MVLLLWGKKKKEKGRKRRRRRRTQRAMDKICGVNERCGEGYQKVLWIKLRFTH